MIEHKDDIYTPILLKLKIHFTFLVDSNIKYISFKVNNITLKKNTLEVFKVP